MPGPDSLPAAPVRHAPTAATTEDLRDNMRRYWEIHSVANSVEEMMLDDSAAEIDKFERPEILSLLPEYAGKSVVELGAGIGRFSAALAETAGNVIAVDFMQSNIDVNIKDNGHLPNLTCLCEDVTKMKLEAASSDLVFSNWLLMYLSDEEVEQLAKDMLTWTKPEGYVFFRESCYHQSGNADRPGGNPTQYRSPQHYQRLFGSSVVSEGGYHFELKFMKTVDTYAKIKGNRNQICFLWKKVKINEALPGNASQSFLDSQQYAVQSIRRYEKIFGSGYISTGGKATTEDFVPMLDLQPGQHVLDVGCGIGGGCFYMAQNYGVRCLGLDLSSNMIGMALERSLGVRLDVTFEIADATQCDLADGSFDVVYSRDTILHIKDKVALFKRFFRWLKPGGKLLISDYCRGELADLSDHFKEYVAQRGYHLKTVDEYTADLKEAGFSSAKGEDRTWQFVDCLQRELTKLQETPELRDELTAQDLTELEAGWKAKLGRCADGDQKWGLWVATKEQ